MIGSFRFDIKHREWWYQRPKIVFAYFQPTLETFKAFP